MRKDLGGRKRGKNGEGRGGKGDEEKGVRATGRNEGEGGEG